MKLTALKTLLSEWGNIVPKKSTETCIEEGSEKMCGPEVFNNILLSYVNNISTKFVNTLNIHLYIFVQYTDIYNTHIPKRGV